MWSVIFRIFVLVGAVASQTVDDCPVGVARDGYLHIYNGHCFEFVLYREREFEDAEQNCRSKGGHLVMVKSQDISDFLVDKLLHTFRFRERVWIGLHDMVTEGIYTWVDKTPLQYSNWESGSAPDHSLEDCVAMDPTTNGDWHDYHCENELFGIINYEKPYICQYTARIPSTTSTTTMKPTTTNRVTTTAKTTRKTSSTSATTKTLCSPFICDKDCGMAGYARDRRTGCFICECNP